MAVKFPLEVKNGVKARNIAELKENFDVEKVVGYFFDGKLKNWLDARYYEEEAEAIAQLAKDDIELGKKLCEIFEVEYDQEKIDQEEIARKNERLAKLKQYTADQEIIDSIDCIAFDQEELAELYDMDVQKIYLCEGDFVIPKSKQDLEYHLIGVPNVVGLSKETDKKSSSNYEKAYEERISDSSDSIKKLPKDIADMIHHDNFIILKDYVVLTSWKNKITCINKNTREAFVICDEHGTGRVAIKDNTIWYTYDDKNIIHNLDTNEKTTIETSLAISASFSRYGNKILYNNEKNILQLLDVNTLEITSVFKNGDISQPIKSGKFVLLKEKIYYIPGKAFGEALFGALSWWMREKQQDIGNENALYCYDIKTKQSNVVCNVLDKEEELYIRELIYEDDNFYFICVNSKMSLGDNDISIIQFSEGTEKKKIFEDNMKEGRLYCSYPYVIYVPSSSMFPVNMYNIKTKVSLQLARGCGEMHGGCYYINRFSVVDHWLYFNKGEEQIMYRMDLENPVSEILIGSDLRK